MTVVANHLKNLLTDGLQASAPPSKQNQSISFQQNQTVQQVKSTGWKKSPHPASIRQNQLISFQQNQTVQQVKSTGRKVPPSSIYPMEPVTPSNIYPMRPLHPCTFYPTESTPLSGVYPVRPSRFNPMTASASNIYIYPVTASPHFDQTTFTSSNPVRPIPSHLMRPAPPRLMIPNYSVQFTGYTLTTTITTTLC